MKGFLAIILGLGGSLLFNRRPISLYISRGSSLFQRFFILRLVKRDTFFHSRPREPVKRRTRNTIPAVLIIRCESDRKRVDTPCNRDRERMHPFAVSIKRSGMRGERYR